MNGISRNKANDIKSDQAQKEKKNPNHNTGQLMMSRWLLIPKVITYQKKKEWVS